MLSHAKPPPTVFSPSPSDHAPSDVNRKRPLRGLSYEPTRYPYRPMSYHAPYPSNDSRSFHTPRLSAWMKVKSYVGSES